MSKKDFSLTLEDPGELDAAEIKKVRKLIEEILTTRKEIERISAEVEKYFDMIEQYNEATEELATMVNPDCDSENPVARVVYGSGKNVELLVESYDLEGDFWCPSSMYC